MSLNTFCYTGFDNLKQMWLRKYESSSFQKDCEYLWNQVRPEDPIPAHLFGNMWSQTWEHLSDFLAPYPNATMFDVTEALKKKYTQDKAGVTEMFKVANEFFTSVGLHDMSVSYGPKAQVVKPADREVVCHASAWDFSNKKDFRIKMCTNVNQEDFVTIHHELGHIQYYINYKNLPETFRQGANPGFHEAIGDVAALSVNTPKHMMKIGLAENQAGISKESSINYLLKTALERVAFLPFGFLIDAYRWKIFDGTIKRKDLEYEWVKMRSEYQGVVPPVIRDEEDFDAGSKYHVPGNTPYIRYFVSHILEFQLYKALCITAQEYPANPLHECDFYQNKDAGAQLKKLLEAGASKNWEIILKETIGQDKMDASAILEYFAPLLEYLREYRAKMNYPIGWSKTAFEALVKRE
ncbi:Angiotensin-converting enzyme [Orchesella cincta]|uniref:Angiotensin-converting enzyme n=1 Tax=Orchesella cincta TaxID=48709 RepID=A0A1D2MW93_ORCCI|nr:Angiotensin-converting enzyme [Orchesella cincta]